MARVNNRPEYLKLEKRLVLLSWLNSLLGYEKNGDLLRDVKEAQEGYPASGLSFVCQRILSRGSKLKIDSSKLESYDRNIQKHLKHINARRPEPITLRYFQYLALLYAEIFLDERFNHPGELVRRLNQFIAERNARLESWESPYAKFELSDLNKCAFWMATGSGKTLLMHINYLQFLHYNKKTLDNLLLITPNEGLSQQHMVEMFASNIPTERFEIEESGLGLSDPNTVRVIEITKLVETKTGSGVSVPVEAFEGNNLIFVDEGHKGSGGTAWRNYREALGKTGFTFEYSATFGQALTAAGRDELTEEYGKAILFDYSYRYFYEDGFGKDFQLLNLRNETAQDETDLLLLGNLLGFYEQSKLYSEKSGDLKAYNIDKPLWVFVGKSVNAVYTENRNKRSDVLTVARFLHRFLANEGNWTIKAIDKLLAGATGLQDGEGKDVFSGKFLYLKDNRASISGNTRGDSDYRLQRSCGRTTSYSKYEGQVW